jgi:hypothetical protein
MSEYNSSEFNLNDHSLSAGDRTVPLEDLARQIRDAHRAAQAAWSNALDHALDAGDVVLEVKARVPNLKRWLKENVKENGFAVSTALLYAQLAEHRGEIEAARRKDHLSLRAARRLIATKKSSQTSTNGSQSTSGPQDHDATSTAVGGLAGAGKPHKQPAKRSNLNRIYREQKLGEATIASLKDTSLDNAREQDELVFLNRGAAEGEHTPIVERLVADAVAGKDVSAIKCTQTGAAFRRDDIGANSTSEIERLCARNKQLEVENARLQRVIEELKARPGPQLDGIPVVEILMALPATSRAEIEERISAHLSTSRLFDLLERRLKREGKKSSIAAARKFRKEIAPSKVITLSAVPAA